MLKLRVQMAQGELNRGAVEMKEVVQAYSDQVVKNKEVPTEEDFDVYLETLESIFEKLAKAAKIVRDARAEEEAAAVVNTEPEEDADNSYGY